MVQVEFGEGEGMGLRVNGVEAVIRLLLDGGSVSANGRAMRRLLLAASL